MPWLAGGSVAVLTVLVYLLYLESRPRADTPHGRPLKVYCAAALKPALESIAADYLHETGRRVEIAFGDSGKMLGQVTVRPDGDLFLPADDSYVRLAEEKGLVARTIPLCRMRPVILTRPGNPYPVVTFDDLLRPGLRVGLANPDRAAIGKVVRDHLTKQGRWDALAARLTTQHLNVTDAANAVQLGGTDATIVWDSVAANYPDLKIVRLPELDGAVGRVELAILAAAPDPAAARRFARYVAASDRGMSHFRKAGFSDVEPGPPWAGAGGEP
jgi:molybdate transport system substrate-binding protein